MLPQAASRAWYHGFDAFRRVPTDLSESSSAGALMTMLAVGLCFWLFCCETAAFLTDKPTTRIVVDTNHDESLQIHFDVTMLDMACDFVTVGVWDAFGTERFNITRDVVKQRVDHRGTQKGKAYQEDELVELEFGEQSFTEEELAELDSDWGSSSDRFKHDNFQAVVDAHDFTMINFYADWCSHCRDFGPTWASLELAVNGGSVQALDADQRPAKLHLLKLNCVDFEDTCREQGIRFYPTVRLYRRSSQEKSLEEYQGDYTEEALKAWMKASIAKRHLHTGASYHSIFTEGCRLSGVLEVARVPGTMHFQVGSSKSRAINPAFTNVSHTVHKLTFGKEPYSLQSRLPREYRSQVRPLDGRTFTVDKFHKELSHFIKVVHTRFDHEHVRSYQQTHQWSVHTVQRRATPQAKFSYDLAPVEVVVGRSERRWYDYLTQILAITGGTFTVMSLLTGVVRASSVQVKVMLDKMK